MGLSTSTFLIAESKKQIVRSPLVYPLSVCATLPQIRPLAPTEKLLYK